MFFLKHHSLRHPCENGDPESHWISAFAGMTSEAETYRMERPNNKGVKNDNLL